jgi:hypothetical protein
MDLDDTNSADKWSPSIDGAILWILRQSSGLPRHLLSQDCVEVSKVPSPYVIRWRILRGIILRVELIDRTQRRSGTQTPAVAEDPRVWFLSSPIMLLSSRCVHRTSAKQTRTLIVALSYVDRRYRRVVPQSRFDLLNLIVMGS